MNPMNPDAATRRRRRLLLLLAVCAVVWTTWRIAASRPAPAAPAETNPNLAAQHPQPSEADGAPPVTVPIDSNSAVPRPDPRFFGPWKDQFYGERTLTFREDGTGTMVIQLEPISRAIYGPELTFHFAWTWDGDAVHMEMTGGEPKDVTEMLSQVFGKTSDKRIERLDDRELHLRSLDSQKLYVHRRD